MKEIPLAHKKGVALVDDADFELVTMFKWHMKSKGRAATNLPKISGKQPTLLMHRLIMDAKAGQQIDHINGDPLDNRRENLRFCTASQNKANTKRHSDCTSGYKGVTWQKSVDKWQAQIQVNGKKKYLGCFGTADDAAKAYDQAAIEHFGEFARPNFQIGEKI